MRGCMDVCSYVGEHVYVYMYICTYVCMYVCVYIYIYMYMFIYAQLSDNHTYMHGERFSLARILTMTPQTCTLQ